MKRWITLGMVILLVLPCTQTSFASARKKKTVATETKKEPTKRQSKYDKLVKNKSCETARGEFVTLHKLDGKVYFEFPVKYLGREMLLASTISEARDNNLCAIGYKPKDPMHIKFTKTDSTIFMREVNVSATCNPQEGHMKEVMARSFMDPIIGSYKIYCYTNDSSAFLLDMTSLFTGNSERLAPFSSGGGMVEITAVFNSAGSILDGIKAFDDNVTVKSYLSYSVSAKMMGMFIVKKNEPLTVKATRTLLLLPEEKMHPRVSDTRIGVFVTNTKQHISTDEDRIQIYTLANRWRVEPKDVEAYKRGELVEPVKPIVFYVDDAFPAMWKEPVRKAALRWNVAFEKIGLKNVIQVRDFPKDDPTFDPDNLKYSCIRYAPIAIENAMGPSWVDPRSGEILNASVYLYHDVIKLLNNWIFIQTAQADKRVRHKIIPREVMDDALRYVVSHEVGHCLGFMHNMSASSVIPVDSLRSPSFTQKHGTTTSIMDYARFNYVAQPGDMERGVRMMPPRFGLYDDYLIRWNYTPVPEAKTEEEEYAITSKWITDLSGDPVYRYGKQQSDILDPRSQTEDLGDDAVKATQYGVKNLKYILANLNQWLDKEDNDYKHRSAIYDGIIMQYLTYMLHVYHNIGGIYLHEKLVGDKVEALESEPKEKQKEAMSYFLEQLETLDWLDNSDVLDKLPMVGKPSDALRNVLMKLLMAAPARVEFSALKAEGDKYDVDECMNDIYEYIWSPTLKGRKLTSTQMKLQNLFIKQLASTAKINWNKDSKSLADEDVWESLTTLHHKIEEGHKGCCVSDLERMFNPVAGFEEPMAEYFVPRNQESMCYGYFLRVRDLLNNQKQHVDKDTRLHYQLLLHQMNNALNR